MYSADSCLFYEEQAHYADDGIQPPVDGVRMAAALGARSVLLVGNHGAVIVEKSLEASTVKALALETSAAMPRRRPAHRRQGDGDGGSGQGQGGVPPYFIPQMWAANYQRVQASPTRTCSPCCRLDSRPVRPRPRSAQV